MLTRKLLIGSLLLLFIIVLGACNSNDASPEQENEEVEEAVEQETKDEQEQVESNTVENEEPTTKMYTTLQGKEIEVPTSPERIVTLAHLGEILKLGIKPVGAVQVFGMDSPHYTEDQISGIEDVGRPASAEKVTALDPDLIIVTTQEEYELLSKIAPTVWIPYGSYANKYEEMTALGELVGKEEEAQAWMNSFKEKVAKAKEELQGVVAEDETVAILQTEESNFYVFGDNMGRGGELIYKELELTPPAIVTETVISGDGWKQISFEALPEYAADHIFLTSYNAQNMEDDKLSEDVQNNPIYQHLAKEHNIYQMDYMSFVFNDPFALEGQLEDILSTLKENN